MLEQYADKVINYFTVISPTQLNCVNKGATSKDSFKEDVYAYMSLNVPEEFHDKCWELLEATAWNYDILKPYIYYEHAVSDIACHAWDNVWVMRRGKWFRLDKAFRNPEHYDRFFSRMCVMHNMRITERNTTDNCTDIETCEDYRLRLNFIHKSINTNKTNVFSIRKVPKVKKLLEDLTKLEEGMLTPDMIPIIKKHVEEATGIFIVGMSGSGKTTFLNALFEILPIKWKFLVVQENEELFSDTRLNCDYLKTVKGINEYDVSHDLKEVSRNSRLMAVNCNIIGEIKGGEAFYFLGMINDGSVGIATGHANCAEKGLDKLADYIRYESDYSKDQCMDMLTAINKVFFLKEYKLREILTIDGYDWDNHKLICTKEVYEPYMSEDDNDV